MCSVGYFHAFCIIYSCVYDCVCTCAAQGYAYKQLQQLSVAHGCECVHLFADIPVEKRTRNEDKLMTPQKKTGPENLPLKAVIALMVAAAATAAVLSGPAKDPRTGFISHSR